MNINREELAWAAGLFDGEGCTWNRDRAGTEGYRKTGMSIGMQVSQSGLSNIEPPVELIRFQNAILSQGKICNRHAARKPHYKYSWDWRVNTWKEVQAVGAMLYQFWSNTKRAQFFKCVTEFQNSPSWGREAGNPYWINGSKNVS